MKFEWSIASHLEFEGRKVDRRTRMGRALGGMLPKNTRAYRLTTKNKAGKPIHMVSIVANEVPRSMLAKWIWEERKALRAQAQL